VRSNKVSIGEVRTEALGWMMSRYPANTWHSLGRERMWTCMLANPGEMSAHVHNSIFPMIKKPRYNPQQPSTIE
jgi:hypothetical protein